MKKFTFILTVVTACCLSGTSFAQNDYLKIHDTRNVNDKPNFLNSSIRADMKLDKTIGLPSRVYSTNITISPWHDDSTGPVHQLNFNYDGMCYRNGTYSGSWNPWKKVVTLDLNNTFDGNLKVKGTLTTQEVIVTLTGWADFVFHPDYQLPTLKEVEKHIQEKGHLPNIPSEAEIKDGEINLTKINILLLQKIEELTLYTIQQQKEIEALKSQINK